MGHPAGHLHVINNIITVLPRSIGHASCNPELDISGDGVTHCSTPKGVPTATQPHGATRSGFELQKEACKFIQTVAPIKVTYSIHLISGQHEACPVGDVSTKCVSSFVLNKVTSTKGQLDRDSNSDGQTTFRRTSGWIHSSITGLNFQNDLTEPPNPNS